MARNASRRLKRKAKAAQKRILEEAILAKYLSEAGWQQGKISPDVWLIPYAGGTMRQRATKSIPPNNTVYLPIRRAARLQQKWDREIEKEKNEPVD